MLTEDSSVEVIGIGMDFTHELDGTITEINLTEPAYDFTTNQNDIYFTNSRKIIKYDVATSSEELIYEYTEIMMLEE